MHLHLEMRNTGRRIQQVPTWTQAERNKTDISVRNTLSQLNWLHHSINTLYRQALIANIWWVWIYKNQTKVPPASALSYAWVCVHCMTMPCLKFPWVHSLTPGRWVTSEASQATVLANLPKQHVSSVAAGWGASGYSQLIRAPGHTELSLWGSYPDLIRSIIADHKWKMGLPTAMPITASQ